MKKLFIMLLATMLLLSGCSDTADSDATNLEKNKTPPEIKEEVYNDSEHSEYEYVSEKMALPSFSEESGAALSEMGISHISDMEIGLIDVDNGDINANIIVADESGREVIVDCMYISIVDAWSVSGIRDVKTNVYYWLHEGAETFFDIYDYETGELIFAKSEEFSVDKMLEDYQKETDKIMDDFDNALDDIAEKYGLD